MNKRIVIVFLAMSLLVNLVLAALLVGDRSCTVQVIEGVEVPLDSESLKQFYPDGIYYHEDDRHDAPERDPLFVVSGDTVLMLRQIVGGWEHEFVGLSFLRQFSNLRPVGQISSFQFYQYYPSQGQIRTADGIVVVDYMKEFDPPYWTWAWNSLIYQKNNTVSIFVIDEDGSYDSEFINLNQE